MADQKAQLDREALGLTDVVFQGITHIGPALNVVFALPEISIRAGAAMPISLALALVACFFIANTAAEFSRYLPTSGGYYTFVSRGFGPRSGFLTAWIFLIYEIAGPAMAIGFLGFTIASSLQASTGIVVSWWIISLATTMIIWAFACFGVRLSAHTTIVLGALELLIILSIGVACLLHPAIGSSVLAPLDPSTAPGGWRGVVAGMVFSILAMGGFEAPAPLARETRRPTRFIYLAIFASLIVVGLFDIFMAYASAIGWGTQGMASFTPDCEPYDILATRFWGPAGRWLILFAITNSAMAVGMSCTNSASRVVYTMAQEGMLPVALKEIHPKYKTPHLAIHVLQMSQMACFLLVGFIFGPGKIFSCLGIIVALAVIMLYVTSNFALTIFIRREYGADFRIWRHGIIPFLGTLSLLPVAAVTVWPIPMYPQNLMPYILIALVISGFIAMRMLEARRPEVFADRPPGNDSDDDASPFE